MSEAFFSGSFIYFGNRECGLGGLSGSIMFACGYYVCLRQEGEWGIGALKRFFWLGAKGIGEPKNLSRQVGDIAISGAVVASMGRSGRPPP